MKKILVLLLITTAAYSQKKYENKAFKFSIQFPENWIEDKSIGIPADKILSKEEINRMFLKDKDIILTYFHKNTLFTSENLNPKVQLDIIYKKEKNFIDFKKKCIESAKILEDNMTNFQFIDPPKETLISNTKSMYFSMRYTLNHEGKPVKIRSRTYAIPIDNDYFLNVSLVDEEIGNDCSNEFDKIIKTLQIF